MRRRVLPVSAAAALIASVALTGCTAVGAAETCIAPFAPGALSDSVRVAGDSAETLKVSVADGITAANSQRSIVTASPEGGEVVEVGSIVAANLAYVDSATGELLEVSPGFGTGKGDSLFLADPESGSIVAGTLCATAGDTVAIALSVEESATMGIEGSLVVVAEITDASSSRASGKTRALPTGFPAVTTNESGQPGIVLPPQAAPTQAKSAVRIEGSGEVVTAESTVIGNVLTVSWDGMIETNSWEQMPQNFGSEADMAQSQMTFRAALTGFKVGSQVVVIEPGDGSPRVSVIDILASL